MGSRTKPRLRALSQDFVAPQTDMERTIAGVWQGLFGLDRVSIEENFFDLGGHSLLLVQMHHQLCEALHTDFPIVKLFEHPTVHALAGYLSASVSDERLHPGVFNRAAKQKDALIKRRQLKKGLR